MTEAVHSLLLRTAASLLLAGAVVGCEGGRTLNAAEPRELPERDAALPLLAECVLNSPRLAVGEGIDAPGRIGFEVNPGPLPPGPCQDNRAFRFGSGLYDITGVVANKSGMGWENPQQVFSGLHTRLHARAYALATPCNGKRVLFVSADIGILWSSLRRGVLAAMAADSQLAAHYGPENLMLSPTHTHSGPAGYSHDDGGNLFHYGYDALVYQTIVDGIVEAIKLAHANLEAHPDSAPITLAIGELLNTNINRSLPAFVMNAPEERAEWRNARGEEITTNKRVVQLNLVRDSGSPVGMINWFGVHPTVIGPSENLVSSDIKGFASLGFERLLGTDYAAEPGVDNFVAAFAQADEGDSSPNIRIEEFPVPDPRRGGGVDDYDSNAISGTKQLAKALELWSRGAALRGPVDYRLVHVQFDEVEITDEVVLGGLRHPPEMDAPVKRTCTGALGASFGAGAEDGRGPTVEGARCDSDLDLLATLLADAEVLRSTTLVGFPGSWPAETIPPFTASAVAMCNFSSLPPFAGDFSCQAEKPVLLPNNNARLPLQIFQIGNLAILGLPWEVTTVSARRLRALLLDELAPAGMDTVVIAGLVNDYVHYLTTREEYAAQQYEGASTLFGPWTLAAVMQESRKLAQALVSPDLELTDPGPLSTQPNVNRPPYTPSDLPGPGRAFGAVVQDVPASAAPGDIVRAEFQAGHPRNDLRTQLSYAYVERQTAAGEWEEVFVDRDPELIFLWKPLVPAILPLDAPLIGTSTAEVIWTIPRNQTLGLYRLRHVGAAQSAPFAAAQPYVGVSGEFEVRGAVQDCP